MYEALRSMGAEGLSAPPPSKVFCRCARFSKSPLNVPFLKKVTKNVLENQYSTRVKIKNNKSLLIGVSQVENIKSETLFNSIQDDLGRMDTLRSRRAKKSSAPPPLKVFCRCVRFSRSPLNVPFLKEVTKNVLKNQRTSVSCQRYHRSNKNDERSS